MPRKRFTTLNEIINHLREADVTAGTRPNRRRSVPADRRVGAELAYRRWRKEYGGLKVDASPQTGMIEDGGDDTIEAENPPG